MCAGTKLISRPAVTSVSRSSASRAPFLMYHWRVEMISSGRSPFSKNLTACTMGLGSPSSSPDSRSSSTLRAFALNTVLPASSAYAAFAASDRMASGGSAISRPSAR